MSSISVRHLYKVFGRRPERGIAALKEGRSRDEIKDEMGLTAAVVNATFDVSPGEIFVVMGLSGSGKSTLIRMVNGLLEPTSGEVTIDDLDVTRAKGDELRRVRREKISMVFQHFALLPHRTVGENAAYALEIQGVNRSEREKKAEEALGMVDLGGWGGSMPSELSGGMRQRVGLARALAAGTDVLLMDEAFSALDPLIRRGMQDQLVELQDRLGKTILFITHDLNEAMRLGDRIAMMRGGEIEQIGTSQEILNEPVNSYVSQFVQDVDRSRVLTAADVMRAPEQAAGSTPDPGGAVAGPTDLLADLYTVAARHGGPISVLDDGRLVGSVPLATLLAAGGTPDGERVTGQVAEEAPGAQSGSHAATPGPSAPAVGGPPPGGADAGGGE
ncbi:glycine betaine/L-proline ABC transporter ATP-binding protein [Janibacter alkaliphilus]|uniref:Glycine betaine/proline transport system ATP-binding protein n=1 Tax=Janibacter alkaliphilus TaxID=1069963 RepID=A0A852XB96_9MICO|nr:betaine/proline/choline family ABC transporter ATP-binding protein [Janibacter alkaliphilus]NYG35791.1 glycine betaine/proline transport system ATP-binding protein [Janibacter alkaliphilus]